jgi:hypothetical protein
MEKVKMLIMPVELQTPTLVDAQRLDIDELDPQAIKKETQAVSESSNVIKDIHLVVKGNFNVCFNQFRRKKIT